VDRTGRVAVSAQFVDIEDFSEGLAAVEVDGKWGYVDTSGKMVIAPQFGHAQRFRGGTARVSTGNRYGLIDKKGKFIWGPEKFKASPWWWLALPEAALMRG
jgi:hypothetical protein